MTIRKQADDLHSALARAWATNCHSKHEAKLFLEDRVEQSSLSRRQQHTLPIQVLQCVFTGSSAQGQGFWHESRVQIFDDTQSSLPASAVSPSGFRITINAPRASTSSRTQDIGTICSAIEKGEVDQQHIAFSLTSGCRTEVDGGCQDAFTTSQAKETVGLKDLLLSTSQGSGGLLRSAWDVKILLALNLASSFLQLLRTPWIAPALSKDTVTLLRASDGDAEISKPLLSVSFEALPNSPAASTTKFELKESLVELGIMLLKSGTGRPLRRDSASGPGPLRPFERQGYALEWLGSILETLPPSYHRAVSHCFTGATTASPPPKGWVDMSLWENMCGNVIVLLAKLVLT
ncbi:hypothetical protein G647_04252 [Cladophialophora carrionii CBS 160.54]|uniref:DUF7580 domain-containing protein n=1 Tax=Cladophialophora carrionii CBS 160.54 TaxID=1279043 RepID=V9DG15_9EURO|nr:uncharacterized protein G647_04252 [Cladophialophora carrionii CBS 160.54]ETI24882.1 hypothetical protein G647_04252 [Cladophialophora carrionii CBS 160.54]